MEDAFLYDRLQFGFTITFHYLFPQLTMGLALIIVYFKARFLKKREERYNKAALFWGKIFALNFVMGVVTGIPMEFQFGTNWSKFSELTGGIIGQTLAMEGMFSFFLESTFLGLFLFGEKRLGHTLHFVTALIVCIGTWLSVAMEGMFSFFLESTFLGLFLFGEKRLGHTLHFVTALIVCIGTWLSGYLILATHSWMQHPVGFEILENGRYVLDNFGALFSNSWLWPSFLHNQTASLITASFVVAGIGAFYMLRNRNTDQGFLYLKTGVVFGVFATVLVAFPFGDELAKQVAKHQPITLAAMEGLFETKEKAPMALVGQPNMKTLTLDNPIEVPGVLSLLTYKRWNAEVKGLKDFDRELWPTNVPGLYYAYHIMIGLGTIFMGIMGLAAWLLYRKKLSTSRTILWLLLLMMPLPYIANTAGWYTAEMGRQPWLVYGYLQTIEGMSMNVSAGNALFTFLGFIGLYLLLGLLFILLIGKMIAKPLKIE